MILGVEHIVVVMSQVETTEPEEEEEGLPVDARMIYNHLPDDHPIVERAREIHRDPKTGEVNESAAEVTGSAFVIERVDETGFTLREACALILRVSEGVSYTESADMMNITRGNYAGKVSNGVRGKIERAQNTIEFVEELKEGLGFEQDI